MLDSHFTNKMSLVIWCQNPDVLVYYKGHKILLLSRIWSSMQKNILIQKDEISKLTKLLHQQWEKNY